MQGSLKSLPLGIFAKIKGLRQKKKYVEDNIDGLKFGEDAVVFDVRHPIIAGALI